METRIVVLAGGQGKRMGEPFAKVLVPFAGKPLIQHLLGAINASKVDPRPTIVLGFDRDRVRRELGEGYEYVIQEEQLGTAHAVQSAEPFLKGKSDAVLVLYGDQPFLKAETIKELARLHAEKQPTITMATVRVPDFKDWRAPFSDFGRVIRDRAGAIHGIVEKKDATSEELAITEVNPSFFCFDAAWLWKNLPDIKNENAQHEYYLPDLIHRAMSFGQKVEVVMVDPREAIGVNTKEQLELVALLNGRKN